MADNNLARSRNDLPDFFADDDPLAELARIVGYEDRPVTKQASPFGDDAYSPRREPAFNLEDELLQEFERYDAPRLDPIHDISIDDAPRAVLFAEPEFDDAVETAAEYPPALLPGDRDSLDGEAFSVSDGEPSYPVGNYRDVSASEPAAAEISDADRIEPVFDLPDLPAVEAVSEAPSTGVAGAVDGFDDEFDLAAELETSIGSEPAVDSEPDVKPEPRAKTGYIPGFRMPLANFNVARAPEPAPRAQPVAPQPVEEALDLPVLEDLPVLGATTPVHEVPVTASQTEKFEQAKAPASAAVSPVATEPPPPTSIEPSAVASSQAEVRSEPESRFSELDELIYDVQRYSLAATREKPDSPAVVEETAAVAAVPAANPAPETIVPVAVPPALEARAAEDAAIDEFDPFSDDEFEIALDDLELDLAELIVEETKKQPEQTARPALESETVSYEPEIAAARTMPSAVAAPAMEPEVREETDLVAELPFDPAQIADAEDHVEAIAELDVPSLPAEEPEQAPAYRPDYDLDIDAELATLLMTPEKAQPTPARKPEIDIASMAPATANRSVQASQPPSYSDLDDFERALEEDFRRSLSAPLQPAAHEELHYGEADYLATVENARRSAVGRFAVPLALVGVVILGGIGAYAWLGSSAPGNVASGEPVVIAADTDPIKVAPENPGGKTVPNQDKAVYDRVAGVSAQDPKQPTLISSSEEPVDVVQKTLMPDSLPLEGENEIEPVEVADTKDARLLPQDEPQETAAAEQPPVTIMPRKVKTMIVRPDGKLVEQEVPAPALAAPETEKLPAAGAKPVEVAAVPAHSPVSVPATPVQTRPVSAAPNANVAPVAAPTTAAPEQMNTGTPAPASPVVDPAATQAAAPAAVPAVDTSAPVIKAPVPRARPAEQPVNVVAAVTDQGNIRAPGQPASQQVASASAQAAPVGEGGYVIQIASLPSQAEAQKSYQSLSAKFGSVIGGRGVDIKAAEVAGKGTFYRVRIPAGGKNDAVALCEKYRAAGGSCLVAR
ncbi:SPOR domain-containing protein [Neorhizobium huautlense]|uniref:SPOR domain-containing protein n=1 Tax=Neorhizobium huautlense TaxID=67774 RepID=UPI000CF94420|nr:SPOR domain-containing protein [Neorhizobium huautlense]